MSDGDFASPSAPLPHDKPPALRCPASRREMTGLGAAREAGMVPTAPPTYNAVKNDYQFPARILARAVPGSSVTDS